MLLGRGLGHYCAGWDTTAIRVCDTLCIKNKVQEMNIFFKEIFVPLTLYYYFYEHISVKLCAWQNYFYI